jgi:hypothetical protein
MREKKQITFAKSLSVRPTETQKYIGFLEAIKISL